MITRTCLNVIETKKFIKTCGLINKNHEKQRGFKEWVVYILQGGETKENDKY